MLIRSSISNIFLLIALTAATFVRIDTLEIEVSDIQNDAYMLLQQLSRAVKDSVDLYVPQIALLPNELQALSRAVRVPATVQIQRIYDDLKEQILDLNPEAEDLGNIDLEKLNNCISVYSYEMERLPKYVELEIQQCLNETVDYGTDLVERAVNSIQNTKTIVDRLVLQLERCNLISNNEQCLISLIEDISVELVDLPAKCEEDAIKTVSVVDALKGTLNPCADDRIDIVNVLGLEIISTIRKCAGMPMTTVNNNHKY